MNVKNRDGARVVGGLILVGVGAALLLRNLGYILPHWLFTWPMILILVGFYSGVKHNFRHPSWLILMAIGGFFLAGNFIDNLDVSRAFWPVIIIGLGIMFILKPRGEHFREKKRFRDRFNDEYSRDTSKDEYIPSTPVTDDKGFVTDTSDLLYVNSVFSGVNKNMMSKNFRGGKITCVFGGADVDFMQADINGRIVLKIELVFGGVKIVVPANWTIVNEIDGMFHGVDDKRKNLSVLPDPSKVLVLKGSAVFGGVDVRSY